PHVYSYEQVLRAVAHQAGLAPLLIPIPFPVWHTLAWASEILPGPSFTRNQVDLMQIDTVSSPEMPGFVELGISPHSVEAILQKMLSNCGWKRLLDPLQRLKGARATSSCIEPPDVRDGSN